MCPDQLAQIINAFLTTVIAAIVCYIAYQQWKTNDKKLKLDIYDRKLKIYKEINQGIAKTLNQIYPYSYDSIVEFKKSTSEAKFLFKSNKIPEYIEEIFKHGTNFIKNQHLYRDNTQEKPQGYDHNKIVNEIEKEDLWLGKQFKVAEDIFSKELNIYK